MSLPNPGDVPARVANRILDDEGWAREKLAAFAGKVFTLAVGPVVSSLSITADGRFETATSAAQADLKLAISPLSIPAFLANPARWNEFVREDGDAQLGGALKELARTLPWFVEAALARVLGNVAGRRVAETGRSLLAFPEHAAQRVAESTASYARDEAGLLARAEQMSTLRDGTTDVAGRVDALAQRFEAVSARAKSTATLVSGMQSPES